MKSFYPVVHVASLTQALDNVKIALDANASGVFLISHALSHRKFIPIALEVRKQCPNCWLGINVLGLNNIDALTKLPDIGNGHFQGFWSDYTGIEENLGSLAQKEASNTLDMVRKKVDHYFGGFAFKYQPEVTNLEYAAKLTAEFVDYLTTSGEETGSSPTPEKIQRIRRACPTKPIAIASGISSENVHLFPDADAFLVASSIGKTFTQLDPAKTKALAYAINHLEK